MNSSTNVSLFRASSYDGVTRAGHASLASLKSDLSGAEMGTPVGCLVVGI